VAFQPLSMNAYIFSGPGHYSTPQGRAQRTVVLRLCLAAAAMMMARLAFLNPLTFLGDRFGRAFPELPRSASAGRCNPQEALCGAELCSYKAAEGQGGSGHLAWSLPLLPSSYYLPNAALHFFVFFMPGLAMARHLIDYLMFPVLLVTGPLVSQYLSATPATAVAVAGAGGAAVTTIAASYAHEWPSVWCMISVVQVALAFIREAVLSSGKSGKAARKAAAVAANGTGKDAAATNGNGAAVALTAVAANGTGKDAAATNGNGAAVALTAVTTTASKPALRRRA
jgi:hypothetical protein